MTRPASNHETGDDIHTAPDPRTRLARRVVELLRDRENRSIPVIVGVAGSVAVGKSFLAEQLVSDVAECFSQTGITGLRSVVLASDAFLLPNQELERRGLTMRKGFPESFDYVAMVSSIEAIRRGDTVDVPVYSHLSYDIVAGEFTKISVPDLMVVEGVNVLQSSPSPEPSLPSLPELFDLRVFLDADEPLIESWFVERFLRMCNEATTAPGSTPETGSFYSGFAGMTEEAVRSIAEWTWSEINAPNLNEWIRPTREVADLIAELGPDHEIRRLVER